MKKAYMVKYRHGLVGDAVVMAKDRDEAIREAYSLCLFRTSCIPENFKPADVIESVEPTDVSPGDCRYVSRPIAENVKMSD
jgi:hypothetical protein